MQPFTLLFTFLLVNGSIMGQAETASSDSDLDYIEASANEQSTLITNHSFDENPTINEPFIKAHSSNEQSKAALHDSPMETPYSIFDVQYGLNTSSTSPSDVPLELVNLKPNPCKRNIYLITDSFIGEWQVWNSLGTILIQGSGKKIDASSLDDGIYFLKLEDRVMPFIKENKNN